MVLKLLCIDNDEKEDRNEGDLTERPEAVLLIEENKNDNEWESFCEVNLKISQFFFLMNFADFSVFICEFFRFW